jgi:2-phosphoglycerate kinase
LILEAGRVTLTTMMWDPFGTLRRVLWIGGGQWAGKSTVARLLAVRHEVTAYHYDYHAARGHLDRRVARRVRQGAPANDPDPDTVWVDTTPERMAADTLAGFSETFDCALDDLRALVSGRPIIAEGWGLRPDLVAPIIDSPRRMIVMVPTPEWRVHQTQALPRAAAIGHPVSDPERAQRNRLERDRLIAEQAVQTAHRYGIRVLTVDGSLDAAAVADLVADHFGPYLPERTAAVR